VGSLGTVAVKDSVFHCLQSNRYENFAKIMFYKLGNNSALAKIFFSGQNLPKFLYDQITVCQNFFMIKSQFAKNSL
jgi:hypothetical protein